MPKAPLRAVQPDDKPRARKPLTLAQAVETGDPLEIALAQRRDIVHRLPDVAGPALAALHRQLSLTTREITDLEAARAESDGGTVGVGDVDDSFDSSAI